MGIDHGRTDVLMSKEFLDRPDIVAVLKQMGGKGMSEGVTTGRLGDPGFSGGIFDSPLDHGFMQVVPVPLEVRRICLGRTWSQALESENVRLSALERSLAVAVVDDLETLEGEEGVWHWDRSCCLRSDY